MIVVVRLHVVLLESASTMLAPEATTATRHRFNGLKPVHWCYHGFPS
jgi:hypothetical protein